MPSAEEDHDHDLPCYTRRRSDYHHRWIFWAVNAAPRYRPFNLLVRVYERNRRERHAFSIDPLLSFSFADKSKEVAVAFVTAKRRQRVRVQTNRPETTLDTSPVPSRTVVVDWNFAIVNGNSNSNSNNNSGARSRCCRQAFCPRVPLLVLRIVAVFCLLLRLRVNVYASNMFIVRKEERRERGAKNGRRHELRTRTETRKAIADRTKNRRRRCLFARSSFVALAWPSLTESPSSLVSFRFHALPSTDSMRG